MKRWITKDDVVESYSKLKQRGYRFFLSKFNFNSQERTKSTFDDTKLETANWWIVPEIKSRWNELVSGDTTINYESYFIDKHCGSKRNLKLLSIGSGICSHEIEFAKNTQIFSKVKCTDITPGLLNQAKIKADRLGLTNIEFIVADLFQMETSEKFDVVLFHQSLHHFNKMEKVLGKIVPSLLNKEGVLLLNEYIGPNRLMWSQKQLKFSNELLSTIPKKYRIRFKTDVIKNQVSGPGYLRMIISDPSEAPESESIIPTLNKHYHTLEQKSLGGNILTLVLKDIAHHFVTPNVETKEILNRLITAEDEFLKHNLSDLIYGVYSLKRS